MTVEWWTKLGEKLGKRAISVEAVMRNGGQVTFVVLEPGGGFADWWLEKWGKAAITLGRTVLFRKGRKTPKRERHELVHVDQWEQYGGLFFFLYLVKADDFEEEAEEAEVKKA